MTTTEKLKKFNSIVVFSNIAFIVLYLYCFGYPKEPIDLMKLTSYLVIFSIAIFWLINNYLWKMKWISSFFGSIPNLNGKWKGTIINQDPNDRKEQFACLEITQTWLNIHVVTKVERGNSSTISSEIIKTNETWKLYFTWNASYAGKVFDGTTIVTILENELDGYYFTNSNQNGNGCTHGSFNVKR